MRGSSPHTRGALPLANLGGVVHGIIPAYAGSTEQPSTKYPSSRDHPRIRGEHDDSDQYSIDGLGSSPHTRGALADGALTQMSIGDHPRIRGEHLPAMPARTRMGGSSPHTRGARRRRLVSDEHRGIIPAYAGSTIDELEAEGLLEDHPRIRGEHPVDEVGELGEGGSSPHTRGAPRSCSERDSPIRIIPAYAGSTDTSQFRRPQRKDHPRIRGEHGKARELRFHTPGSSPHTRGARACSATTRHCLGIIPAYAGSTRRPAWSTGGVTDHPRIRGEHKEPDPSPKRGPGSSPHTRGARAAS